MDASSLGGSSDDSSDLLALKVLSGVSDSSSTSDNLSLKSVVLCLNISELVVLVSSESSGDVLSSALEDSVSDDLSSVDLLLESISLHHVVLVSVDGMVPSSED